MLASRKIWNAGTCWLAAISLLMLVAGCDTPEEKAQSHYERGAKLLEEKNFVKAGLEFRNALQIDRKLVPAWYGLAQVEEKKQNWTDATKMLRNVVELDPKHLQATKRLASIFLAAGRIPDALKYGNAAFDLAPKDADVLALRAAIFFKLGDKERAKQEAEKALTFDPQNISANIVLAADRLAADDAAGALAYLQNSLQKNEKDIGLNLFKIRVLESLKDEKQAEAVFRKLIEFYPKTKAFHKALVNFYIKLDRKDEAEKEIRALAATHPDDKSAALDVVRFLNTFKGTEAAKAELTARIEQGGDVFQYKLALAQLHMTGGKLDDATQLLKKVIEEEGDAKNGIIARNRLAQLLLSRRKSDEAEKVVAEILAKDERNVNALMLRASLKIEQNKVDDAIADLRTALNEAPRSAPVLVLLARAHELGGAIDLADDRFGVAAKTANYAPGVGLRYAQFLLRHRKLERAEDVLTEILARRPKNKNALIRLGEVRLRRQNWLGAEQIAETLRTISKDKGIASEILSAALAGQKKHDESIKVLQEAYDDTPAAVRPMVSLYRAYIRAKKYDEAETFLTAVLEANSDNAEAHVLIGNLHLLKKQPDMAEKRFKTAIEKQPKNIVGYRAISNFYKRGKRIEDALLVVRQGIEKLPDSFLLRLVLSDLLQTSGDYGAAIEEYEALLKERPRSVIIANNLANLYSEHRDDNDSLERAYTIAQQFKNSRIPHFKDTLGWILHRRGDHKQAVSLLREAADRLPTQPVVRYHLGMSYMENKQNDDALKELTKALELSKDREFPQKSKIIEALSILKSVPKSTVPAK